MQIIEHEAEETNGRGVDDVGGDVSVECVGREEVGHEDPVDADELFDRLVTFVGRGEPRHECSEALIGRFGPVLVGLLQLG